MDSTKSLARRAGLLYLLACLPAPLALIYLPSKLFVAGDATATADRFRASETLVRLGIGAELLNSVLMIFAVLALYRLFKGVSETLAVAMVTLMLISIPLSLANVVNAIAPLVLVNGRAFLSVLDKSQVDALVYLFLRLHSQGFVVAQIFWGLWLLPYGILIIRSGFIPRVLGYVLMIAGVGYVANSLTSLFLPQYVRLVSQAAVVFEAGELPILVWLLVWGAKHTPSGAPEVPANKRAIPALEGP